MSSFVDPRSEPTPSDPRPPPRTTSDQASLRELHDLCGAGRLYDIERWIGAGNSLQAPPAARSGGRHVESALEIALGEGNQALVLLLLCNGYDPNLECDSPLNRALRARRWDLLDLLLEWGADPKRVARSDLFGTYSSKLWERFLALGVNLTAGHALAEALAYHTSNKPLFGFAKRHREDIPGMQQELNIALVHHTEEGNEKGVQLALWAGADPHAPAHSFRSPEDLYRDENDVDEEERFDGFSAIHAACLRGDASVLKRLSPDPSRDDYDDLFMTAENRAIVEVLAKKALPKNAGGIIRWHLWRVASPFFGRPPSTDTLETLFRIGMRWIEDTPQNVGEVRRLLLKMTDYRFEDVMKLLAAGGHCSPVILRDLARTPKMRERMRKVGFIPLPEDHPRRYEQRRPTRSREVLGKFGVELPKPKPRIPAWIEIGSWRNRGETLELTREEFFERVWSMPVEDLAKSWGLSGRGLAKACERIKVPVPPRGYWAKVHAGRNPERPSLPRLASGEGARVVVRIPKLE